MSKMTFWNTLATADLARARAFYDAIGFDTQSGPPGTPCFTVRVGEGGMVCLFERAAFAAMLPGEICDTARAHELIQSISVPEKAEIEALAEKVQAAGGRLLGAPRDEPFGRAVGFTDLDGHAWSALWFGA